MFRPQERTSTTAFLAASRDSSGLLHWLEHRIAAVTHLPVEYGEV